MSLWQRTKGWAYRHRGKLALTAAAAAAAAAAYSYGRELIEHRLQEWQNSAAASAEARRNRRRHFRRSQTICRRAVREAVPSVIARLRELLDCEALKEEIRTGMGRDEKRQAFERLRDMAWTRCVATHYAIAMLVILLKIQGNVQAARLASSAKAASADAADSGVETTEGGADGDAEGRHEFVALMERFCRHGIAQLVDDVAPTVTATVAKVKLTEKVTAQELGGILRSARLAMEEDKTLPQRLSSWLFPDQGASEAGASGATSLADTAKDVAETDYFYTTAQSCLTFVEESAASALAIALFPPETPASGIAMVSATPVAALTPVNETRMADMAEAITAIPALTAFCETIFESLNESQ